MTTKKERTYYSTQNKIVNSFFHIAIYTAFLLTNIDYIIAAFKENDVLILIVSTIVFLIVTMSLYYIIFRESKSKLTITVDSISDEMQSISLPENLVILQITDFKNLAVAQRDFLNASKNTTVFFLVEKNTDASHGKKLYVLDTGKWQIDDIADLTCFFADIGFPVQEVSAEYINDLYFPRHVGIGSKSGVASFMAIFCMIVATVVMLFDKYRTLDYGFWFYLGWLNFILITAVCFYVIKTDKKLWIIQLIPALLLAATATYMLSVSINVLSQFTGSKEVTEFRYLDEDTVKGVRWQHTGEPAYIANCGDPKEADKDNDTDTIRQATLLKSLGMIRINQIEMCQDGK